VLAPLQDEVKFPAVQIDGGLTTNNNNGIAIIAKAQTAGRFEGDTEITGTLTVNGDIVLPLGGDCAEEFEIDTSDEVEPGTVMIFDGSGALEPSTRPYDKRVAGVRLREMFQARHPWPTRA